MKASVALRQGEGAEAGQDAATDPEVAKPADFRDQAALYSGPVMTRLEARRIDNRPGRLVLSMTMQAQASAEGMGI